MALMAYDLAEDGTAKFRKTLVDYSPYDGPDGLICDKHGNLIVAVRAENDLLDRYIDFPHLGFQGTKPPCLPLRIRALRQRIRARHAKDVFQSRLHGLLVNQRGGAIVGGPLNRDSCHFPLERPSLIDLRGADHGGTDEKGSEGEFHVVYGLWILKAMASPISVVDTRRQPRSNTSAVRRPA